jgi:hypothetical protein
MFEVYLDNALLFEIPQRVFYFVYFDAHWGGYIRITLASPGEGLGDYEVYRGRDSLKEILLPGSLDFNLKNNVQISREQALKTYRETFGEPSSEEWE